MNVKKTILKTITVCGDSRKWTGSFEQYEKHGEFIDHWVKGGEVEIKDEVNKWFYISGGNIHFLLDNEYRKKQREPKAGEVWEVSGHICVCTKTSDKYNMCEINGKGLTPYKDGDKYLAPSIAAYFARKFLEIPDHASWPRDIENDYIVCALKELAITRENHGTN